MSVVVRQLEKDTSGVLTSAFSADGNTLLLGPGADRLAFDLRTRTPIKISGALTSYEFPVTYCFEGNDKIVAIHASQAENSGVFSFPEGKRLQSLKLGLSFMHATTGAGYVITSGSNGAAVAVVDVRATKYVFAARTPAVDIFGDSFVNENLDGSLTLGRLGDQPPAHLLRANMPLSPLAPARSASISLDGRYLALSARAPWRCVGHLASGKQIFLVRGFRSSSSAPEGKLLAEFTQSDKTTPQPSRNSHPNLVSPGL